ncbi:membrane-spanning 4-domains subfamily A member 13 [Desmodus rotundus]|uniref:membrane-spanning 4-domains subfamily A member 13 n=1 Tax=Desmodus rotundus TaxID=9430 RepID=UPI00238141ED|nr:membrane-spanning 4-domains subfamily A member 13 [Desmodus rotundus]
MAQCSKISTADALVLGAVQILIGIFHIFMWYFLLIMYMGQIKGVFGTYEPLTYKLGCPLWGIFFIISGISLIKIARHPTPRLVTCALIFHMFCIIVIIVAVTLTILELSRFDSVSYRNYGQAKLGREVSRILLSSYSLELAIAFTYCIFGCIELTHRSFRAPTTEVSARDSSRSPIPLPNRTLGHNCGVGTARGGMRGTTTTTTTTTTTKEAARTHAARIPGAERSKSKGATC